MFIPVVIRYGSWTTLIQDETLAESKSSLSYVLDYNEAFPVGIYSTEDNIFYLYKSSVDIIDTKVDKETFKKIYKTLEVESFNQVIEFEDI